MTLIEEELARRDEVLTKLKEENPTWGRDRLSEASNIPPSSVKRWLKKYINRGGGTLGHIEEGMAMNKTSTLYRPDGSIALQWVKASRDKEDLLEALREAADGIIEPCRGLAKPVDCPVETMSELMTLYPIPEPHIGMYCWDKETGNNYDTDIATDNMLSCFSYLVEASPASETCLFANLADFMHMDNEAGRTERSGHDLDTDTRWGRVIKKSAWCLREMINIALRKHKTVYYKSGKGNHDDKASIMFAMLIEAYFEDEPRVIVEVPYNPFSYHEFGLNLFGIHHGDVKAPKNLPLIMAADRNEAWGRTKFRTFIIGHKHHKEVMEYIGCIVEMFRTIAPEDAHHNRGGYRHLRSAEAITYNETDGEVSRVIKNM
jgi:hypothetical protein